MCNTCLMLAEESLTGVMGLPMHETKPLHSSAIGKAMLSLIDDKEILSLAGRAPAQHPGPAGGAGCSSPRGENVPDVMVRIEKKEKEFVGLLKDTGYTAGNAGWTVSSPLSSSRRTAERGRMVHIGCCRKVAINSESASISKRGRSSTR
jgi:hypothetical protein